MKVKDYEGPLLVVCMECDTDWETENSRLCRGWTRLYEWSAKHARAVHGEPENIFVLGEVTALKGDETVLVLWLKRGTNA